MTSASILKASRWLSKANLRPTRQRLALAEALIGDGHHRHVTAESLFENVQHLGNKVSLATVYNTLRVFCDSGLMQEVTVDFYWEDEGKLTDAPADQLKIKELPLAPEGAEISSVDVIIRLRKKST